MEEDSILEGTKPAATRAIRQQDIVSKVFMAPLTRVFIIMGSVVAVPGGPGTMGLCNLSARNDFLL
jgi:hypothetical protein